MNAEDIIRILQQDQTLATGIVATAAVLLFIITRYGIARWLTQLVSRTRTTYDDILIKHLQLNRLAFIAPLILVYLAAVAFPGAQAILSKTALFLILWLTIFTISGLLTAVNEIYEARKTYSGVSIQSYLDIVKILAIIVGVILSITLFTGESPLVLLTGLGALTAVLLLIFQNTILSLVASIQIVTNDLLKEGDWVEIPSYDADGDVVNINLHSIKIRNFDMTYSVIPTYKITDVAFKNWRGMKEAGGRRIQRSVSIDQISIKFCDDEMLARLRKIDLLQEWLAPRIDSLTQYRQVNAAHNDSPLDGPQITNIEVFRAYISAYLRNRQDIRKDDMPFLVRSLAPTPTGLPIELYIFTRTIDWAEYENIQAEIFDHLLAAAGSFDLRVFQEPTGLDFTAFGKTIGNQVAPAAPVNVAVNGKGKLKKQALQQLKQASATDAPRAG